ncbi:sulfurtransferase TusA family protein [Alkalibacter mobilis]|uniref:sulfurtransferase TusA family protein n=1 Tax=Alkalibacter mobilis TaxID=2787712 RepID=UPI0018A04672|nr:sulfurtransferase TusA family protein [Alkalibacter mobilis]
MKEIIDASGLSCPQPVIRTLNAIKKTQENELTIIVDTETSKENISRAAQAQGWKVDDVVFEDDQYRILIRKE